MRIIALVLAAFAMAFIAAPIAAADPVDPVYCHEQQVPGCIPSKSTEHNPAAPPGIVPMPIPADDSTKDQGKIKHIRPEIDTKSKVVGVIGFLTLVGFFVAAVRHNAHQVTPSGRRYLY